MKKLLIMLFLLLFSTSDLFAWTARVEFTPPENPAHVTDVLVSEVSGDYSNAYGQRSEPGASFVEIGNIKPSTTYYFVAYRLSPWSWEKSENSEEVVFMTGAYIEPVLYELPPLEIGNVLLNITIEIK